MCFEFCKSSIGKKQIVAVTGLLLIVFILGHLAGNLIMYLGADAYNSYAKKLASLRPGLYFIEFGLFIVFLIHITFTAIVVIQNIQSRPIGYRVFRPSAERSIATRLMPYTGTILIVFVISHLLDFTFVDHEGPKSFLADGKSYGLYGVVYNAFSDPVQSLFYVIAMFSLGLHLSHGMESFVQTFGLNHPRHTPFLVQASRWSGFVIALLYSSIPVYILWLNSI